MEPVQFWSKVAVGELGQCWPWERSTTGKDYGQFRWKGVLWLAHRFAYTVAVGPIPPGHDIHHKEECHNRLCCNPAHLEPLTRADHLRQIGHAAAIESARTECPQGHPYDEANTYHYRGSRQCRACRKVHNRNRKKKGAVLCT